uniref:Uncharacterized protein n=1 Tax=Romanomermis culicivorax TaxID=13658 RepID=A0A915I0K9_ROMCU
MMGKNITTRNYLQREEKEDRTVGMPLSFLTKEFLGRDTSKWITVDVKYVDDMKQSVCYSKHAVRDMRARLPFPVPPILLGLCQHLKANLSRIMSTLKE